MFGEKEQYFLKIEFFEKEKGYECIASWKCYKTKGRNTIGYFDYAGCLYPQGQNSQMTYFFNHEDIEEIYFTGYVDEMEKEFLEQYELQKDKIKYPKLKIKED